MKTFEDLRNDLANKDPNLFISLEITGKLMAKRYQKNITQRELAELSGVPQKTISRIESGVDIPKLPTLMKLAKGLGLRVEVSFVELEKEDKSVKH